VAVSFLVEETGVPEKTIDLSQVTDKFHHLKLYRVYLVMNEVRTHNFSGQKTIILYISYSHLDTTISYHDYDAEHQ
jgi:hypothetical protein